ncbi:Cytochrome c oxidase assembly protein cox18, mitochondrial [Coemansia javaensis]|uniref:Cytochrome c oxidase assembly protein cox18, mitochondrial n=1 Tax=Coemansia javaensis TaxID=2761396 RepID=A0A9W8LLY3_9FUNG|nr:Cytochrome c oxidase assembly protein cox18, mitochondrial [Coemansia javaensis]
MFAVGVGRSGPARLLARIRRPIPARGVLGAAGRRHMSAAGGGGPASVGGAPEGSILLVDVAQSALEALHDGTLLAAAGAMPWWAAIGAATAALHLALVLPLRVYQQRTAARVQRLRPAMQAWRFGVESSLRLETRGQGLDGAAMRRLLRRRLLLKNNELLLTQGCHPMFLLLLPLAQLPVWFSVSYALRHLCGRAVWLLDSDSAVYAVADGMRTEGALWFADLAANDPTHCLPLVVFAASMANVVLSHMALRGMAAGRAPWFVRLGAAVSYTAPFVMGYVSLLQPAGLVLYWAASSGLALAANLALRSGALRRALRLPQPAPELRLPYSPAEAARSRALAHKQPTQN